MLTKVVLEKSNAIFSGRKAFADIDGRGIVLCKV